MERKGPPPDQSRLTLTLGAPVRGVNMYGRQREVAALWSRLQRDHILLLAPRRVGKTSVMYRLLDQPASGWDVVLLNVEEFTYPEQFVAALAEELKQRRQFREPMESIRPSLRRMLHRVKRVGPLELAPEDDVDWRELGRSLFRPLRNAVSSDDHPPSILVIIDEFPYFVRRMATTTEHGARLVEDFLSWFRTLRLDPALDGKVRYLLGGSIGLAGLLGRLRLSSLANDLSPFYLGPFDRPTARTFLLEMEAGEGIDLHTEEREAILDQLRYLLPFHMQLLMSEIRQVSPSVSRDGRVESALESLLGPRSEQLRHMAERLSDAFPDEMDRQMADALLRHACQRPEGISRGVADQLKDQILGGAKFADERLLAVLDALEHDGYLAFLPGPDDTPGCYQFQSELLRRWWKRRNPAMSP